MKADFFGCKLKKILLFFLILIAGLSLRLADYQKDPFHISASKSAFVDPGIYNFNAKVKIFSGEFAFEEYNYHLLFPLNSWLSYACFKICGIDYFKIILLFGFLGLLYCLVYSASFNNERASLFILFITAFSFIDISFNRSALIENYLLLISVLSLFFFTLENKYASFFSGIMIIAGVAVKTSFLIIAAGFSVYAVFDFFRLKKKYVYFFSGIFFGLLIAALLLWFHREEYYELKNSVIIRHVFSDHSGSSILNFFNILIFFKSNLFARIIAFYPFILGGIYKIVLSNEKKNSVYSITILIFLFNIIFTGLSPDYSPLRYRIFFIFCIPIFISAFFFIKEYRTNNLIKFIVIFLFFYPLSWYLIEKKSGLNSGAAIIFISLILSAVSYFSLNRFKIPEISIKLFIVIFFVFNTGQYLLVYGKTGYDMKNNFEKINKIIPPASKVIGWWAPQICFNRRDILVIPGKPYKEYISKYSPDFIIDIPDRDNAFTADYYLFEKLNFSAIKVKISVYKKK